MAVTEERREIHLSKESIQFLVLRRKKKKASREFNGQDQTKDREKHVQIIWSQSLRREKQ